MTFDTFSHNMTKYLLLNSLHNVGWDSIISIKTEYQAIFSVYVGSHVIRF